MQAPDGNGPRKRPARKQASRPREDPQRHAIRQQARRTDASKPASQQRAQTSLHAQHAQEQAYPGRGKAHQQEQAQGTAASEENGCGSKGYTQRIKRVLYILRHKEYTRLHVKIFIKS